MQGKSPAEVLASVSTELFASADEAVTTERIVGRAVELVADAEHASLTVRRGRRQHETLSSTSTLAVALDAAQYRLDEGPCVDVSDHGEWFRSGGLGHDDRWPRWGPETARQGIHSILSVRLLSQDKPLGALNLYSAPPGAFADRDQLELALLYATHAAQALKAARLVKNLETAMDSRHQIGVAQGIVMQRYDLGVDQAFEAMRRVSQQRNVKLRELALEIIEMRGLPQADPEE